MKVLGKRAMLNRPGFESVAAIVAEASDSPYGWNSTVSISDCGRVVGLSCSAPDAEHVEDFENTLFKLDTIIDCVKTFRRDLVRERKRLGLEMP